MYFNLVNTNSSFIVLPICTKRGRCIQNKLGSDSPLATFRRNESIEDSVLIEFLVRNLMEIY